MSLADEWDAIPAGSQAAAAPASLADEWDAIKPDAGAHDAKASATPAEEPRREPATLQLGKAALNQVTGLGASIMGGWRGLAALASGAGLDEAARQVGSPDLAGGTTARAFEGGSNMEKAAAAPGALFGAVAAKAGQKVYDVTGSPAAAAATETTLNAVPLVLVKGGKRSIGASAEKVVGSGSIADEGRPPPPPQVTAEPNYDIPTVLRRRQAQPVEVASANQPSATAAAPAATVPMLELPQDLAKRAEAEAPKFADSAPPAEVGKTLPQSEQTRRAGVLQRIGLTEARESAVNGDAKAASTDFQSSRLDNSAGTFMRSTLDNERAALTGHAEQIVRDTGGTLGTDAQSLETRGHAILQPLEAFKQWFTDQTKGLYDEARARGVGQALNTPKLMEQLQQKSNFTGNTDTLQLRQGVIDRMKELGMLDEDGQTPGLSTVDQAENLRKYINERWTPNSNGVVRDLKSALDNDVASAAGEDVFKKARALHAMKASIFDDPKGLSSILDSEGINRKVDVEKVADTITALPNAQFAHIVKTLQTVPPELAPQAQAALAEIKAQFANRMKDAGSSRVGQWGARDVTGYLSKNGVKMQMVFEPEEMAKVRDLNDAGHILAKDTSYPGAAVQAHNLVQRGVIAALPKVSAAVGATLGSILGPAGTAGGALVGDTAGTSMAARIGERAALNAAKKRVVKLGDFPK